MDSVSARFQHTNLGAPILIGLSSIEYIVSTQRRELRASRFRSQSF